MTPEEYRQRQLDRIAAREERAANLTPVSQAPAEATRAGWQPLLDALTSWREAWGNRRF